MYPCLSFTSTYLPRVSQTTPLAHARLHHARLAGSCTILFTAHLPRQHPITSRLDYDMLHYYANTLSQLRVSSVSPPSYSSLDINMLHCVWWHKPLSHSAARDMFILTPKKEAPPLTSAVCAQDSHQNYCFLSRPTPTAFAAMDACMHVCMLARRAM